MTQDSEPHPSGSEFHGPQLRPLRLKRVALHVGLGKFSLWVALHYLNARQELFCTALICVVLASIEATRFSHEGVNQWFVDVAGNMAHPHEHTRVTSSTWFWLAMLLVALIENQLVMALSLGILSVGDQAASLVGRRFGRTPLRGGRSLEGSLAFVVLGAAVSYLVLHFYFATIQGSDLVWLTIFPATCGALSEWACVRVDDNFGVGLGTGFSTWALTLWLGV